jgi:hypothetical protein
LCLTIWEVKMTLCVAAYSPRYRTFVTVSDLLLSTDYMSAETSSMKIKPLSPTGRWICMFAGSPSIYGSVLKRIRAHLTKADESGESVRSAAENAFRDELSHKIEGQLLSPYGLTRKEFLEQGKSYFGDEQFTRILYDLNAINLDTSFIIAGFDLDDSPHLFSVVDPGITEDHLSLGFHAIGSGSRQCVGALFGTYDSSLSTVDLIYRLCEAKFLGESAMGVGKKTFVDIFSADGTHQGLVPELVEPIRIIWQKEGLPPLPSRARDEIERSLHTIGWTKVGIDVGDLKIGASDVVLEEPGLKEVMQKNSEELDGLTKIDPC